MKCKCGNEAELIQMDIYDEEEPICRACFNALGHEPPKEPEYEDDLFYASQMGGYGDGVRSFQVKIEDFER